MASDTKRRQITQLEFRLGHSKLLYQQGADIRCMRLRSGSCSNWGLLRRVRVLPSFITPATDYEQPDFSRGAYTMLRPSLTRVGLRRADVSRSSVIREYYIVYYLEPSQVT